jgi:hypothetical protein
MGYIVMENALYLWVVKMQYPHDKLKNPLLMVGENAIPTSQTKNPLLMVCENALFT